MRSCGILFVLVLLPFLVGCTTPTPAATPTPTCTPTPTATQAPTPTPVPTPTITPTPDLRVTNPENQHQYLLVNTPMSWHKASEHCTSLGGHLVTIQSAAENQFVSRMSMSSGTWLGATDEIQEGVWIWVTGESWDYSNWYPGEPNNCCPPTHCGPQDCTPEHYLTGDYTGQWNDTPDGQMHFVCEWDSVSQSPSHNLTLTSIVGLLL